jgi:hypothetical protein
VKKPRQVAVQKEKDPPILRNPFLDGIDPILRARQTGLRSLRIDRGSAPSQAKAPSLAIARPAIPPVAPKQGFGAIVGGLLGR